MGAYVVCVRCVGAYVVCVRCVHVQVVSDGGHVCVNYMFGCVLIIIELCVHLRCL